MSLKTIFAAPFFSVDVTNEKHAPGSIGYAAPPAELPDSVETVPCSLRSERVASG